MIVARLDEAGTLSVIDRLREPVRLGGGFTKSGKLSKEARNRALECLGRFAESKLGEARRPPGFNVIRQVLHGLQRETIGLIQLAGPAGVSCQSLQATEQV